MNAELSDRILAFCQRWRICEFSLVDAVWCNDVGDDDPAEESKNGVDALVQFEVEAAPTVLDLAQMKDELKQLFGKPLNLLPRESVEQSENYIRRQRILKSANVIYDSGCCRPIACLEAPKAITLEEQDAVLLLDILIACRRIQRYTTDICWEKFQQCDCTLLQDATVQQLELIGNAVQHLSQRTKNQHPDIPWEQIMDICDCLVCENHRADADTIWEVVQKGVPRLIQCIERLVPPEEQTLDYKSLSFASEPA